MRVRVVLIEHVRARGRPDLFPVLLTIENGRERPPTEEDATIAAAAMELMVRLIRAHPRERWPFDLARPPARLSSMFDWLAGEAALTVPHPEYARLIFGVTQAELAHASAEDEECPICRQLHADVRAGRAVVEELEHGVISRLRARGRSHVGRDLEARRLPEARHPRGVVLRTRSPLVPRAAR